MSFKSNKADATADELKLVDEEVSETKDEKKPKESELMDLQIDEDGYSESSGSYENKGGRKHAGKTTGIDTRSGAGKSKLPLMLKVVRNGAAVYGSYVSSMYTHIEKSEAAHKEEHRQKYSAIAEMKEMVGSRDVSFSECFEKANHEARMAELAKKKEKFAKRKKKVEAIGNAIASIGGKASSIADMGAKKETNTLLAGRTDGTTAEIPTTEGAVTAANRARQAESVINKASGSEGVQYD